MKTNGFALFRGPLAWERAEEALSRVDRYRRHLLTSSGPVFGATGDATREAGTCFLAWSLEERGELPLVHGFVEGRRSITGGSTLGEFAFVASEGGRILAGRDRLGTRPLYLDDARTCLASDHRFFSQPPRLLPRGTTVDMGTGEMFGPATIQAPRVADPGAAAILLCRLLEESVARRVKGRKRVAVSFSGGLDSSIIALLASRHCEVVLCSAFTESSNDREYTSSAARRLDLEHHGVLVGSDDALRELRSMNLPFQASPMDRALWCLYSTTARMASEYRAELILLGQLADELFGGYMKYSLAARESEAGAVRMMEADVAASADRAFVRDELACSRFTEVRFPFADHDVAAFATGIPLSFKISGGERKAVLRKAASILGLPDELVRAPKKAAQYSSGLSKLVS
jgi:asparagine synthase (glutamine-hydrolysing)